MAIILMSWQLFAFFAPWRWSSFPENTQVE